MTDGANNIAHTANAVEILVGGPGGDTFRFADGTALAGGTGRIDGGGGTNALDYSAWTTAVVVNLTAGTATGTAGVQKIQNVIGGSGNDVLGGDAAANVLTGGVGNDALAIGGNDTLRGSEGDDRIDLSGLPGDAVTVDGGEGSDAILVSQGTISTAQLSLTGVEALRVDGGTLVVADDLTVRDLTLGGGMLTGSGGLTVTGTLTWTGGAMTAQGATVLAAGGELNVSGAADKRLDLRTLTNHGRAVWTGAGHILADNGTTWDNRTGTTLRSSATPASCGAAGRRRTSSTPAP